MTPIPSLSVRAFQSDKVRAPRDATLWVRPTGLHNREALIDLEIGSGVGWWAIQYATQNPDRHLIAIEHTKEKFSSFHQRLKTNPEIKNLTAIHTDAVAWVTHCLGTQKLSRIFILYPNPNPKNEARRWIRMPFFRLLLEKLAPQGEIIFATNIKEYAEEIRQYAEEYWGLKKTRDQALVQGHLPQGYPRTHFEKKYLARGETCFDLVFEKTDRKAE